MSGCASVEIDQSAAVFDETKYAVDLNNWRGDHWLAATFETGKYSTAGGALGAIHGLGAAIRVDSFNRGDDHRCCQWWMFGCRSWHL